MKKILYGTIAAILSLTACETIQQLENTTETYQEEIPVAGQEMEDSVVFSANIGVPSKTYLEYNGRGYKTLWSEGDQILVWDTSCFEGGDITGMYEFCTLKKGAGTTAAEFVGSLHAESYLAVYARDNYGPVDGYPRIGLPNSQQLIYKGDEPNISDYSWPMIAASETKEFEFQNLCSIIKLSLTGNGETVSKIQIDSKSGNESLSGQFLITGIDDYGFLEPYSASPALYYYCNTTLTQDPLDCYIVVPAQYYSEGLTFTINSDYGAMSVSTDELTTYRSRFYDISVDFAPETISDLLGDYAATGYSYYYEDISWTISINESHDDTRVLWFCNLVDGLSIQETRFYGVVNEDETKISIPLGQTTEYLYEGEHAIILYGFDGQNVYDVASLEVDILREGDDITLDFGEYGIAVYVDGLGYWDVLYPGIVAIRN